MEVKMLLHMPVDYWGKHEKRYCVTRRELLAVVHFIHLFHPHLLGKEFILRTDHGSLTWLTNFREPEGQLARWLERLQEYTFKVINRRERKHNNADALSLMPCQQCGRENHDDYSNEVDCAEIPTPRYPTRTRHPPYHYSTVILY